MSNKALLAKIRKCLALAKGGNEHEAAAALAKAKALMDEHGVSEAQLAMSEIEEATARSSRTKRPPLWESALCRTVERALGVITFLDERGDRVFVGRGPEAEIASYAFAFLFRRLKAARSAYIAKHLRRCRPGRKRQRANIYCEGWAASVYRKVTALLPAREPDPLLNQYLVEKHPCLVSIGVRSAQMKGRSVWDDYGRGHVAGSRVELNHGVCAATPVLLS